MKKLLYFSVFAAFILCMIGCSKGKRQTPVLKADLDAAQVVTMNPEDIIWLETNDSSIIFDISNISFLNGRMLLQSRSLWKIFSKDGEYLGEVAGKGEAPEDFLWMGNIWNDDSLVYMYDHSQKKIQKYDSEGRYHGYDTICQGASGDFDANPSEVYLTDNDGVFYVNRFLGSAPYNNVFSHAKDTRTVPKGIKGRQHESGHTFYNRVWIDNDNHRLLYWEHIKDTLFVATKDEVAPLYIFDYGKSTVPSEYTEIQSPAQRFFELQKLGDNNYAYPMRYFQMHDGKIYFLVPRSMHGYIGCIDESKDAVAFTEFVTPDSLRLLPQLFFKIDGDDILLSVIDENQPEINPGLLRYPISQLNKP